MIEGRPSSTAFAVAVRRAVHQLIDQPPVFQDPLALAIVGRKTAATLQQDVGAHRGAFSRALRAFIAVRSRLAEHLLADAYAGGVRQYVVLGAGLDTFAYRNPHAGLRVFEVDAPATQAWKRARLAAGEIPVPDGVRFVDCDFASQSVSRRLLSAGLDPSAPTFISWLGVSMYLEPAVVIATICELKPYITAPGGIVFDYGARPRWYKLTARIGIWLLSRRVARAGEPFRSAFVPAELAEAVRATGCTPTRDYDSVALTEQYFSGRSDGLRPRGGRLLHVQA